MNGAARPTLPVTRRLLAPVEARLARDYGVKLRPHDRPLSAEAPAWGVRQP